MMPRLFRIRRGRRDRDAEVREEIDTHVAMWTDHLVALGHSHADAERIARQRFGDVDAALTRLIESSEHRERTMIRKEWWSAIGRDLVFSFRQAQRQPAFTTVALLTFALGIGANTAMFSVVHGILLRPLPYEQPQRLAAIWPTRTISNAELRYFQQESRTFKEVAAFSPGWGIAMTGAGEPRQLDAARVSTNFFRTLGVRPALGRAFTDVESDPGKWSVAILSHALWASQFGGDSAVIGRVVSMDGQPCEIVGVMPAGFEAFQPHVEAWLPLMIDPTSPFFSGATALAFGRLAPGATVAAATAELAAFAPRLRDLYRYDDSYAKGATVTDLHDSLVGSTRTSLLVLIGAVALLVLIAVANVANLLVLHASGRRRELAVRRALGASRSQIMRQLLVQSVALAIGGGVLGVEAGSFGLRALKAILPPTLPMLDGASIDGGVLAACAAITLGAGILFGTWPAMVASRVDPEATLRVGASDTGGRGTVIVRQALVVVEVGLAVVLVIGAALMATTLWRLDRVDVGFDPHGVTSFRLQPSSGQITSVEQGRVYFGEMTRRLAAIPGVVAAGGAQHLPLSGFNWGGDLEIESRPLPATAAHPRVVWRTIVGDYFGAMRIPLVRGRLFTSSDVRETTPVVIIGAAMAKKFWPGRDPIGERIRFGNGSRRDWVTIVGIVGDVKSASIDAPPVNEVYRPNAQQGQNLMHFVVRTTDARPHIVQQIRAAVRSLDQTVPIAEIRSLDDVFIASTAARRTVGELLGAFAALGLILGAIGIYGVISSSVSQRSREIGIRTALGAAAPRIAVMVITESLRVSAIGIAVGSAAALIATRSMQSMLFGVGAAEPSVYVGVALAIAAVAIAAAYIPARRAARVDPLIALRDG